jgi:hypothetical protein
LETKGQMTKKFQMTKKKKKKTKGSIEKKINKIDFDFVKLNIYIMLNLFPNNVTKQIIGPNPSNPKLI